MTDDTSSSVDFERNSHTVTNRTAVAAVVVVAAVDQPRPHLGDYPVGLDETATYSGISSPNAAPSPITYHPCASAARRNVLVAYRLIYELPVNFPSSSHRDEYHNYFFFFSFFSSFFFYFFFAAGMYATEQRRFIGLLVRLPPLSFEAVTVYVVQGRGTLVCYGTNDCVRCCR